MNVKTLLITGGCGYVGSRVVKRLANDFKIVVADKISPEDRSVVLPDNVEFRLGDLRDANNCLAALKGVDYVLHLAANIGPLTYMHEHQAEIMQENSAIDASLYQAIHEIGGVKAIIYSSSSMVFQHSPRYPYTEEDVQKINPPTNVYGFSKLIGEYFCKSYNAQYGLNYVILRYHNIYGPGEDSKGSSPGDIHVIPALIEKVLSGQYPIKLLGDPEATRPFTYVDDAVEATVRIVEEVAKGNTRVINTDFNIGNRQAMKIIDLAEMIWDLLGNGAPFKYIVEETKAITSKRRELDPAKIESAICWAPKMMLEEGIKITAEWIRVRKK